MSSREAAEAAAESGGRRNAAASSERRRGGGGAGFEEEEEEAAATPKPLSSSIGSRLAAPRMTSALLEGRERSSSCCLLLPCRRSRSTMTAAVFVDDFDGVVVRRLVAVISGLSEARPPVGDAIVFSADRIVLVWAQTHRAIGRAEEKPRGKISSFSKMFFFKECSRAHFRVFAFLGASKHLLLFPSRHTRGAALSFLLFPSLLVKDGRCLLEPVALDVPGEGVQDRDGERG